MDSIEATPAAQHGAGCIGKIGRISWNGISFDVAVESARRRYGHTDLLVRPVAGDGARWVERTKVIFSN